METDHRPFSVFSTGSYQYYMYLFIRTIKVHVKTQAGTGLRENADLNNYSNNENKNKMIPYHWSFVVKTYKIKKTTELYVRYIV